MNNTFKPFRLINASELDYFQQKFKQILANWNQLYAGKPLSMEISRLINKPTESNENSDKKLLLLSNKKPLALLEKSYLTLVKESLFADQSLCFDKASAEILRFLLKELLAVETLEEVDDRTNPSNWFYSGSPCLLVKFGCINKSFNLYLHPDWVLNCLPKQKMSLPALAKLDEALASKELALTLELQTQKINLSKLLSLQVGDVIKTTHLISNPLIIRHQQQSVFEVESR